MIEHASCKLRHANVAAYLTAAWMRQQLREVISSDHDYRFLIHDRDSIFSRSLACKNRSVIMMIRIFAHHNPRVKRGCRISASSRRDAKQIVMALP